MKRLFIVLLIISMLLVMTACVGSSGEINSSMDSEDVTSENVTVEKEAEEEQSEEPAEEVPIHPDEIKPEITILEPDSIGNVYMEATYTNNSKYPITAYQLTVLLKDKNEKTYLSNYDTVMPGETSPKFESFGPQTQDPNDYEILTLEVTARTEEGNDLYIEYDFKLEEANWFESE